MSDPKSISPTWNDQDATDSVAPTHSGSKAYNLVVLDPGLCELPCVDQMMETINTTASPPVVDLSRTLHAHHLFTALPNTTPPLIS